MVSDTESESEIRGAGECFLASSEEWIKDDISEKLEDFRGVSGITTEYNHPQSVSELAELIFGWSK